MSELVVTGSTGHLGRYVVQAALEAGHAVLALSREGRAPAPPFGRTRPAGAALRTAALELGRDACVGALEAQLGPAQTLLHLAAWHPEGTANTDASQRARLLEVNVLGTMRVLEAAARAGVGSVVYASSFEVYGEPRDNPIDESHRTDPLTDYGATKLSGEDHLLSFAAEEKRRAVALRMPALYGPGERTPRALPNFLALVARGERPTVAGDGLDQRALLHARDAAASVLLAALSPSAHGIFNVADGRAYSIAQLARAAMDAGGLEGEPRTAPREKPRRDYQLCIAKARRELGFAPSCVLEHELPAQLAWLRAGAP